jgi:hypothetical protein
MGTLENSRNSIASSQVPCTDAGQRHDPWLKTALAEARCGSLSVTAMLVSYAIIGPGLRA